MSWSVAYGIEADTINAVPNRTEIDLKKFDQDIIISLQEDAEFQYVMPPDKMPNFFKMIFQAFFKWLLFIFGNETLVWLVLILLIIIGVVGLGFAFYGIFGIGKTIPIYGEDRAALDYIVKEENIHELNFNEEIDLAVDQLNYKKAIRLMYLYALKLLADRHVIEWQPSKTNHEYVYEIQNHGFLQQFSQLGYYFEYVWYGDFRAEIVHYKAMNEALVDLKTKLQENA